MCSTAARREILTLLRQHHFEHLMIVYFDVLLIDDESLLATKHSRRFQTLTSLVSCRRGHAQLVDRQIITFENNNAASDLRNVFARTICAREEGLVLKPDEPYFDFDSSGGYVGCPIKLKKEYIGNFGDVGDLCLVAARYDPGKAKECSIPRLKWTHFYLGCLNNKLDVQRGLCRPDFTVVNVVELSETILQSLLKYSSPNPVAYDQNDAIGLKIAPGVDPGRQPTVVFSPPLVVDVRCFSFDMVGNTGYWSLRFPSVSKLHHDRLWQDTLSFDELQAMAEEAKETPPMPDSQELLDWIAKLENADPRGRPVDAISQSSTPAPSTPSVREGTAGTENHMSPPRSARSAVQSQESRVHERAVLEAATPSSLADPTNNSSPGQSNGSVSRNLKRHQLKRRGSQSLVSASGKRPKQGATTPRHAKTFHSPTNIASSPGQTRQPLADKSPNVSFSARESTTCSSFCSDMDKEHHSQDKAAPRSFNMAQAELPENNMSSQTPTSAEASTSSFTTDHAHSSGNNASSQTAPSSPPEARSKSLPSRVVATLPAKVLCLTKGDECLLQDCVVLLSPCIATMPYVTDDLLQRHGVTHFVTRPEDWAGRVTYTRLESGVARYPETHLRKICFVEARREGPTREFMRRIEEANVRVADGTREWVTVYDWRVLEAILALEMGDKSCFAGFPSVWRKFVIGMV